MTLRNAGRFSSSYTFDHCTLFVDRVNHDVTSVARALKSELLRLLSICLTFYLLENAKNSPWRADPVQQEQLGGLKIIHVTGQSRGQLLCLMPSSNRNRIAGHKELRTAMADIQVSVLYQSKGDT